MATRMTHQPTFGTMDPFDPDTDNWPAYAERLEQFFVANDIADGKKVAILLTMINTKTYTYIVTKYPGTRQASIKGLRSTNRNTKRSLEPKAYRDS